MHLTLLRARSCCRSAAMLASLGAGVVKLDVVPNPRRCGLRQKCYLPVGSVKAPIERPCARFCALSHTTQKTLCSPGTEKILILSFRRGAADDRPDAASAPELKRAVVESWRSCCLSLIIYAVPTPSSIIANNKETTKISIVRQLNLCIKSTESESRQCGKRP